MILKLLKNFYSLFKWLKYSFKNYQKPIHVLTREKKLLEPKIHVRNGKVNIQGWINIDTTGALYIHIQSKIFSLDEFQDETKGKIYLYYLLENYSFEKVNEIIDIFYRYLKKDRFIFSVHNLDYLINFYIKNNNYFNSIKFALMRVQDYLYNYHKVIFNEEYLFNILKNKIFIIYFIGI